MALMLLSSRTQLVKMTAARWGRVFPPAEQVARWSEAMGRRAAGGTGGSLASVNFLVSPLLASLQQGTPTSWFTSQSATALNNHHRMKRPKLHFRPFLPPLITSHCVCHGENHPATFVISIFGGRQIIFIFLVLTSGSPLYLLEPFRRRARVESAWLALLPPEGGGEKAGGVASLPRQTLVTSSSISSNSSRRTRRRTGGGAAGGDV